MANNVIRSAPSIKAGGVVFGGLLPLEQLFGRGAVLGHSLDMRFDPRDFGLERGDSFFEFGNRDRVEVLLAKLGQRVLGLVEGRRNPCRNR